VSASSSSGATSTGLSFSHTRQPVSTARRDGNVHWTVDEGYPIAYEVLESGVPVYASGGEQVGTVDHVIAAEEKDIFHGIVIRAERSRRFVAADQIVSLHERGVDLGIDAAEAGTLPEPGGAAPAWRVHEPGVKPSRWKEMVSFLGGKGRHRGEWDRED
jgi:hypothetical protein